MRLISGYGSVLALLVILCSCGPLSSRVGGGLPSEPGEERLRPGRDLPAVTLPAVTLPAVTLPAVTLPAVTLPAVTLPAVTVGEHVFHRRLLGNGLRAVAVWEAGDAVSVFMVIAAGKRQETRATTGLAHLTEHAMYAGTPSTGPDEHDRRIEEMGGKSNAFTREDYTFFYDHDVPPEHLRELLAMEADRLRNLSFDEDAVYRERERLREEEERDRGPSGHLTELLEAAVFRTHPYGVGVRGEDGHTRAPGLEISQIREFYDRFYRPNRTAVVVAGALEPRRALDDIEEVFGPLEPGRPQPEPPVEPEIEKPRSVDLLSTLSRDRLEWVWLVPAMGHPDRPALGVLGRLLSRRSVGEGVPIVASMGGRVDKDVFRLAATGPRASGYLEEVLGDLLSGELQASEVEEIKGLLAGRFTEQPLRARPYFSLAGSFGVYEVLGHAEELATYETAVRGLTTREVLNVARRHLDPQKRVSVRFVGTGATPEPLPDDPQRLARAAVEATEAGDLDRAVEAYTKLLAGNPSKMGEVIALASRGQVRLQQRDYASAIEDFESALEVIDYPDVRDLLDEARALAAGLPPDTLVEEEPPGPTSSEIGGASMEPPHAAADPLAEAKAALTAQLETARHELEDWRGLRFQRDAMPEFVEPRPDKLRGWYDPETGRLIVSVEGSEAFSRGTLLHELGHALQDQHWDLSSLEEAVETSDEERALQGLIEGEAMLAVSEIMDYDFERHARLPEEGPLERDRFEKIYAYGVGLRFVRALRERGGWAAVNRAWDAPPRTTAEVYHPERYPAADAGNLEPSAVEGEVVESDRRGEFELRWLIVQEQSTRARVDEIASGLLADRWRLICLSNTEEREHWDLRFVDHVAAKQFVEQCREATRREDWVVELDGREVRMQRTPRSRPTLGTPGH